MPATAPCWLLECEIAGLAHFHPALLPLLWGEGKGTVQSEERHVLALILPRQEPNSSTHNSARRAPQRLSQAPQPSQASLLHDSNTPSNRAIGPIMRDLSLD